GAEADRGDREPALPSPAEQLLDLLDAPWLRERPRPPARSERRVARELDALLDLHASCSSSSAAARSTSPAPSVRTRPPGRTQPATSRTASSSAGAQPRRRPGRATASASTISRPLTPGIGSSRAG